MGQLDPRNHTHHRSLLAYFLTNRTARRQIMVGMNLFAAKKILGNRGQTTIMRNSHLSAGIFNEAVNHQNLVELGR
jgi:hypothetical protein